MKKIFLLSLLASVGIATSWAEDFLVNVHVHAKVTYMGLDGKKHNTLDISEALIYITEADGSVRREQVFPTQANGQLIYDGRDAKVDYRLRLDKNMGGRYVVNYIISDKLRYEKNRETGRKEWQIYDADKKDYVVVKNPRSVSDAYYGSFTLDLATQKGTEVTIPFTVNLSADDKAYYTQRLHGATVRGRDKVSDPLGPQGEDGARVGKYENFSVRFLVPRDSLKSYYRIVAQPVWVDKKENTTYYGDPLTYYCRDFYYTRSRESSFHNGVQQDGLPFFNGYINTNNYYAQDDAAADDLLRHHSLTEREELHYPRAHNMGPRAQDSLYFRLPLYIKVDESMADNDCVAMVKWVLTDYTKILSEHCDTIIEGRSDPLRYLQYNVGGLLDEGMRDERSDEYWFPESANGSHDADCSLRIFFETGKTTLDWEKENNALQKQEALNTIRTVQQTPDSYIRAVYITGFASPDGNEQINRKLAAGRTQEFKQWFRSVMPEASQYIYEKSEIASWAMVADTLRMWGKLNGNIGDFADEETVRTAFPDRQDPTLRAALDAVRVITFRITYEIQAAYTPEELIELHDRNGGKLSQDFMYREIYRHYVDNKEYGAAQRVCQQIYDSKYHIYRRNLDRMENLRDMYNAAAATERRLKREFLADTLNVEARASHEAAIERRDSIGRALGNEINICHEMLLYANDLCAIKLMRSEGDTTLLAPFTVMPDCRLRDRRHNNVSINGVPDVVLLNQAAAYLTCKRPGWARTYMSFYEKRAYPDRNRATANEKVKQLQDVIAVKTSTRGITPEQVNSIEAINPINGILGVLAMDSPSNEDFEHAKKLALDTSLVSDSVATNNIVRALWYGRDFNRRNNTYKLMPEDYYDPELEQGARYLQNALRQDPDLTEMAQAQRDLKPIFKVLDRIRRDEELIKNIKVVRRNRAKEK